MTNQHDLPSRSVHGSEADHVASAPQNAGWMRRFRQSADGATVVEFALILPIFLFLIMGIFQIGFVFTASQVVESATSDLARFVRTGQAQTQGITQEQFRDRFCAAVSNFLPCNSADLRIDLEVLPSFGSVSLASPVGADGSFADSGSYEPGDSGDIVVLRIFYQYRVWLPWIGAALADLPNGRRLIASGIAFKNEPF